jgi:hypothetical protein
VTKTTLANVNFEGFEDFRTRFANVAIADAELRQKYMITDEDIQNKTANWRRYKDELV